MADGKLTYTEKSDDFGSNLYMTFRYESGEVARFGYIITAKAFYTFVGSNQQDGTRLIEESVKFPEIFMHGSTRRALVHYINGEKFACYVPVFPTQDEVEKYNMGFGR